MEGDVVSDEEDEYQQAIVAQRRAAYGYERDGYLRYGQADRARAVQEAYEVEFGAPMETATPTAPVEKRRPKKK